MRIPGGFPGDPGLGRVLAMLDSGGHRALIVGGAVRNAVLGQPIGDIDIATDARPERVVELAAAAGLKSVPTGIEHGTVTVVSGGIPFEITTFRRDVETDGRNATVAFSDRIEPFWLRSGILAGTPVETLDGPVAVEKLRLGDVVLTAESGPQPVPQRRWNS